MSSYPLVRAGQRARKHRQFTNIHWSSIPRRISFKKWYNGIVETLGLAGVDISRWVVQHFRCVFTPVCKQCFGLGRSALDVVLLKHSPAQCKAKGCIYACQRSSTRRRFATTRVQPHFVIPIQFHWVMSTFGWLVSCNRQVQDRLKSVALRKTTCAAQRNLLLMWLTDRLCATSEMWTSLSFLPGYCVLKLVCCPNKSKRLIAVLCQSN